LGKEERGTRRGGDKETGDKGTRRRKFLILLSSLFLIPSSPCLPLSPGLLVSLSPLFPNPHSRLPI
jgi:hypothetical protein